MKQNLRLQILDILEDNAKATCEEMAMMLDSTEDKIAKEIEQLEEEKIIVKYTAVVNRQKLDEDHAADALIEVKITPQREYGYNDLARRIYNFEEVREVYLMAGSYDLAVRVRGRNMREISKFVFEKLSVLDGVTSTVTLFIMLKYKESGVVLVDNERDERLVVTP